MTFGLENKKVALVGLDGDICDAYTPYLKKQGIKDIRVFPKIVKPETLLESDASLIHLTHNKQDINFWVANLLIAHKAGLFMLIMQYDMYDADVQARITLQQAGVRIRRSSNYRPIFHELVDYLKMTDFTE